MTRDNDDALVMPLWPDAGQLLGIGRSLTYAAAARGEIPTIKFGKRIMVPKKAFYRWLEDGYDPERR